ncbi:MAG: flagellin [Clostridia bacterium]
MDAAASIKEDVTAMSLIIDTNQQALFAQNAVESTTQAMSKTQEELATGLAINSPADNPAGLAISDLMSAELGGLTAATQNANQGINLLQTAAGGVQSDTQIVQQIQQLAVQASNGTNSSQDQQDIQSQIGQLLTQLDNNASSINYNGLTLLGGSYGSSITGFTTGGTIANVALGPDSGNAAAGTYSVSMTSVGVGQVDIVVTNASGTTVAAATVSATGSTATAQLVNGTGAIEDNFAGSFVFQFNATSVAAAAAGYSTSFQIASAADSMSLQVGPDQGASNQVAAALGGFTSVTLGLSELSVVGQTNAQNAITQAQNALSMLTNANGALGAQLDALNATVNNLSTESQNLQAAQSTILDANMAQVSSQFAEQQVLQQTGLQALATDNQLPATLLKTLGL